MKKFIFVIALLVSANVDAQSFVSGNSLLSDLTDDSAFNRDYALGYIIGVVDVINQLQIEGDLL